MVAISDNLKVKLESDSQTLTDVVVIGYGTARKSDLTGSVATVKAKDFNQGIVSSPEQLINGKVSGTADNCWNIWFKDDVTGGEMTITVNLNTMTWSYEKIVLCLLLSKVCANLCTKYFEKSKLIHHKIIIIVLSLQKIAS